MQNHTHTHTHLLHQKRHRLANPRRFVLLHACKWVGKSYKKLYCTKIITQACLLICKITHTHTDYSHHWYIRRLQCGHIFMTRYAKSHTQIDFARRSILLAGRRSYSPLACSSWRDMLQILASSSCLQVSTSERCREGGNISLKNPSSGGKAKGSPSVTEKLQQTSHRLVLPDARRFWATFPWHSCEQGVYHKDVSSSCARGMSNPITHITRILLATKISRRRKKREKQKLAPYKIYFCATARSRSREEGSKWLTLLYQKKEP
jgi:hypothetical protein